MDSLVTTQWLAGELGGPDLRILDATYFLPEHRRDANAEHAAAHIAGAAFLDLATLVDPETDVPNMLPSADLVAGRLSALGVGDHDRIILYDDSPLHSAARAWWVLRSYGATRIAILDGGLARWRDEGRDLTGETATASPTVFTPQLDTRQRRTQDDVTANLATNAEQLLDARASARFTDGHIPGARNLPFSDLLRPDGTWKQGPDLRAAFDRSGIDLDRPVVTTCNSGVTACVLVFGAHLLGRDVALYDGSWSEWGADPATPRALGPA